MSFFNSGPSPTKSSDASNAENGDFNMFGGGAAETGSFFGGGISNPVDSSSGSFFSVGPAEAGGSMFGSSGTGTRQQEDASPGTASAKYGHPTPATIIKSNPSQSQALPSTSTTWGGPPPNAIAHPAPIPSPAWGPPPQQDTRSHQGGQSYGHSQNPQQGRAACEAPSFSNPIPPAQSTSTESHHYQPQAQQPPPATNQAGSDSYAQSSALREKAADEFKKDEDDEMSAEALLKDMIDMQKQQLYELVPRMKRSEEMSEQILTSASLVLRDVTNYKKKLAMTKQLYCGRLSQVSSCLGMIPKTEK